MSLFGKKKTKITVTPKDPIFYVRFIGKIETFTAYGKGCSRLPVQKLWDHSVEERKMKRIAVSISTAGIRLKDIDNKKEPEQAFDIKHITYCNADRDINQRIFTWIYKYADQRKMDCFAVLCSSQEKAQAMALVLSRTFQIAYAHWKKEKSLTKRQHSKAEQGESGPLPNSQNGATAYELSKGISQMNILPDDNISQASSDNNMRIMDEEAEDEIQHNTRVQALACGDMSTDDIDHKQ